MQIAPLQLSVRLAMLLAAVCTVFLMIGGAAGADPSVTPTLGVWNMWSLPVRLSGASRSPT